MGKKGNWFSAIKRVFVSPSSKDKIVVTEAEERIDNKKNKNKGAVKGRRNNGERKSFIPLFREPSSIEKILGEAEREHNLSFRPLASTPSPLPLRQPEQQLRQPEQQQLRQPEQQQLRQPEQQQPQPQLRHPEQQQPQPLRQPEQQQQQQLRNAAASSVEPLSHPLPLPSPRAVVPPRAASPRPPSPRAAASPRKRPEPTLRNQHASATKIQAAYRGYVARRSFRALRGLVRLQGVVKGQNVKRQTMNAMKYMQMLVRVQSQIQSRRIQMLETQARNQAHYKDADTKFTLASDGGNNNNWDDSVLTKEEVDVRLQRKVEAIMKRERAMAYAYSNQLWKSTPKSTHTGSDVRSSGVPWWWNWLERQLPQQTLTDTQTPKSYRLTPARANSSNSRPISSSNNNSNRPHQLNLGGFNNTEAAATPRSTIIPSRLAQTPSPSGRGRNPLFGGSRSRPGGGGGVPLRDDDSLVSCPPFSVPNYMVPTASAQAKARPNSNPRERFPGTPGSESSRRSSFPLTQMGSYKWNKGSFFSGKDSSSQRGKGGLDKNYTRQSMDNKSVDSTVSLPVGVGRKPFNRFV